MKITPDPRETAKTSSPKAPTNLSTLFALGRRADLDLGKTINP